MAKKAQITMSTRREVAQRHGCSIGRTVRATCALCGSGGSIEWRVGASGRGQGQVIFQGLELDHIKPEALGGATASVNLQLACRPCNRSKGARVKGVA